MSSRKQIITLSSALLCLFVVFGSPAALAQVVPIGTVNGVVLDTDDGTTHRSSYAPPSGNSAGTTVATVQGVVYEKTLQAISNSVNTYKGFFMQNTATTADGDPNTSDGLFVFMGTASTVACPTCPGGRYTPAVGDEVVISGRVSEYYYMTELSASLTVLSVVRSGVVIDAELPPVAANPPVDLADANRYWERLQGMLVQVPQNSVVLGGRNVFSPPDAEIWVARPDSTIAERPNPYERRAFRDAHPLDDNYEPTNWDGNGYRILLGSLGIKGATDNAQALIDPARTFDTVANAPAGGVNYTYSKYRIEITAQPNVSPGIDAAGNNPPQAFDRSHYFSIADYNLETLYDYRDNPFSGCDFPGNPGCPLVPPFLYAVWPPFDYVPASDAAYQARLADIATQIVGDLHNPDILMVQEVENQDICIVTGGALVCGATDNADGKPDALQELALKIASLGGPTYDAAFDRDSADLRGITPAFLYRTDRVQLLGAIGDPVLGGSPSIDGYTAVPYNSNVTNPKSLNALLPVGIPPCDTTWVFPRAPSIALFRIYRTSVGQGAYNDVYVINNHFRSGPDTCVEHRTEQAGYNAALVAFLQAAKPYARIVLGGDLNIYPRPDNTAYGASDQLASLYDPALDLKNLWEVLAEEAPESAYSTAYLGMAQTIDHMFVNQPLLEDLSEFRIAHVNSDFPEDYGSDAARGTGTHDPNVAVFKFGAEASLFEDCYMSGGGALWGPFVPPLPPGKTVLVNYSILLSCPNVTNHTRALSVPMLMPRETNLLTVSWGSSNRFAMKGVPVITCGTELFPYFTSIRGHGEGTWNWMPGYWVEFEFWDNFLTGNRDTASIKIGRKAPYAVMLDAQEAAITTGGSAAHCPAMTSN